MPEKFYIVGLPRSRTAWFSNLMTTDNSVCYHEMSPFAWDDMHSIFSNSSKMYVGEANPDPLSAEYVIKTCGIDKVLVIMRDVDEVINSIAKVLKKNRDELLNNEGIYNRLYRNIMVLDNIKQYQGVMVVEYRDLINIKVIEDCFKYLTPNILFDAERAVLLSHLNITANYDYSLPEEIQRKINNTKLMEK